MTFTASNGESSSSKTTTFSVRELTLASVSNQSVVADNNLSFALVGTSSLAATLSYSCSASCPAGLTVNSSSGAVSWTPTTGQAGTYSGVTFSVSDGVISATRSATITVTAPYTFTNCSATGANGPSQAQCNTAYTGTSLAGSVTLSSGVQSWTVPATGNYTIEAWGAAGGTHTYTPGYAGGAGARMKGTFSLTAGTVVKVVVGQKGGDSLNVDNAAPGGGGGTFVWNNADTSNPLVAAGGGAGGSRNDVATKHATITTSANHSQCSSNGGTGGNGGGVNTGGNSYWAGGGAGWLTDGTGGNNATAYSYTAGTEGAQGGRRPLAGAIGGTRYNDSTDEGGDGGFGGGGGGGSDNMGTGGGGGYSGGGGCNSVVSNGQGGGGGSYNAGTSPDNTAAYNTGHGKVIITAVP